MTIYYVNHRTVNGLHMAMDSEKHADLEAIREEYVVGAKQIIADRLAGGAPLSEVLNQSFEVTDESGNNVLLISFADALETDTRNKIKTVIY